MGIFEIFTMCEYQNAYKPNSRSILNTQFRFSSSIHASFFPNNSFILTDAPDKVSKRLTTTCGSYAMRVRETFF